MTPTLESLKKEARERFAEKFLRTALCDATEDEIKAVEDFLDMLIAETARAVKDAVMPKESDDNGLFGWGWDKCRSFFSDNFTRFING